MDKLDGKKSIKDIVKTAKRIIFQKDERITFLESIAKHAMDGREPILLQMPGEIKVSNLKDINVKADVKMPDVQKVTIIESPEVKVDKASKWVPNLITHSLKALIDGLDIRLGKGIEVYSSTEDKLRPQAVIVVDVQGRPVSFGGGATTIVPMPGGTGGTPPPANINCNRKTVTTPGTAERLTTTFTLCRKVIITAPSGNGGEVYVGCSQVSAVAGSQKGLLLLPTGSVSIDINDVSKIYIDATVAGEGVTYTYLT
jgi:hypothetical protein